MIHVVMYSEQRNTVLSIVLVLSITNDYSQCLQVLFSANLTPCKDTR